MGCKVWCIKELHSALLVVDNIADFKYLKRFFSLGGEFNDVITAMLQQNDDSSTDSDSSEKDDLDMILLDYVFPKTTRSDIPRINLEDLSESHCEEVFR